MTAYAASAPVYIDTNANGQFDAGETSAAIAGGNGGSTNTRRFDLSIDRFPAQDSVVIDFSRVDNSLSISLNGTNIFLPPIAQLENIGSGETKLTIGGVYLTQPWIVNTNGLPRLRVTISPTGIIVSGARTTTSTVLQTMIATTGAFVTPTFVNGQNTIVIVNPNGGGQDLINGVISANFDPIIRGITLSKTPSVSSVTTSGTSVSYTLNVANTGNLPITGITLTDSISPVVCPVTGNATIASIGAGLSVACNAAYTVTLSDLDNRGGGDGDIDNAATVSGTQQGQTVNANTEASVGLVFNPSLSIEKSIPAATPTPLVVNQIITYQYDATNVGNVTLSNVDILDIHAGNGTLPVPLNEVILVDGSPSETSTDVTINDGVWSTLRPGDTVRLTATYTVTQTDIDLLQ